SPASSAIATYTTAFLTPPQSILVRAGFETSFWVALAASFFVAMTFGVILGAPTLRLRGDYLAIVTLAFGEIVPRVFLNLEHLTHGSRGMSPIGRPHLPWIDFTADGPAIAQKELFASDQVLWYYLIFLIGALSL